MKNKTIVFWCVGVLAVIGMVGFFTYNLGKSSHQEKRAIIKDKKEESKVEFSKELMDIIGTDEKVPTLEQFNKQYEKQLEQLVNDKLDSDDFKETIIKDYNFGVYLMYIENQLVPKDEVSELKTGSLDTVSFIRTDYAELVRLLKIDMSGGKAFPGSSIAMLGYFNDEGSSTGLTVKQEEKIEPAGRYFSKNEGFTDISDDISVGYFHLNDGTIPGVGFEVNGSLLIKKDMKVKDLLEVINGLKFKLDDTELVTMYDVLPDMESVGTKSDRKTEFKVKLNKDLGYINSMENSAIYQEFGGDSEIYAGTVLNLSGGYKGNKTDFESVTFGETRFELEKLSGEKKYNVITISPF